MLLNGSFFIQWRRIKKNKENRKNHMNYKMSSVHDLTLHSFMWCGALLYFYIVGIEQHDLYLYKCICILYRDVSGIVANCLQINMHMCAFMHEWYAELLMPVPFIFSFQPSKHKLHANHAKKNQIHSQFYFVLRFMNCDFKTWLWASE